MSPWGGECVQIHVAGPFRLLREFQDGIFHGCVRVAVIARGGKGAFGDEVSEIDHDVPRQFRQQMENFLTICWRWAGRGEPRLRLLKPGGWHVCEILWQGGHGNVDLGGGGGGVGHCGAAIARECSVKC